jgi:NAD dependent epimerase/dehydratase family enzyme
MTPIFKVGPGVPIGSGGRLVAQGNQWMSWIHIDDIVGIFRLALENTGASGPLNGTAPEPVRNSEFAKTFSAVLRTRATPWRAYLPFGPPDAVLRLVLGEVASVLTTGQRVLPTKALSLGYRFKYPHLADALRAVIARPPEPSAETQPAHSAGAHSGH